MIVREVSRKALFVALAFTLILPLSARAYNKSWDQGHQCIETSPGSGLWGRYNYAGVWVGSVSSKECCEVLCTICPVYANTGRLHKTYTDLTLPGLGSSLAVMRTYQSQEWATTLFGRGWVFNLGRRIIIVRNRDGDKVVGVLRDTGERNFFKENADGTMQLLAEYGVAYALAKNPDGTYTIAERDGTVQHIDADGKPIDLFDKNGNKSSFEYNAVGCLSRITNASGNYIDFVLGPNGKIASISDNLGRTVQYAYDTNGNLVSSTDPMGNATQYAYDSQNRLTSITDPRGNTVLAVTYDNFQPSRVATMTEKGETWTINYYTGYTIKRDSSGHAWTYYFNNLGIIERVVDPLGHEKKQSHNRVTSTSLEWEEDANGNRTTYTYDADGNITSKTDPLGNAWQYTYVAGTNRVETETNPLGVVTKYEYDANGNQTKVIRDFGGSLENTTLYTYDARGNQISVTDPLGNKTTYEYNANGNLTKATDALGNVTAYTYDGLGHRLTETNARGATTTYTYDLMGRLCTVTDALGGKTAYTYDANGNRVSETNAKDNATDYTYDAWNRLTKITDPLGNNTAYTYDSSDNRTSTTDGNGHVTNYTYDLAHHLVRETNALGGQTNYTYDAAGNVLTTTDACGNPTTFRYDAMNRRVAETNAAGQTRSYAYDATGNLQAVATPDGNTITHTDDALGRLVRLSDNLGVLASYTYDLAGRQLTTTDAVGNTTTYGYDENGHVTRITDPMGNSTAYVYDPVGGLLTSTDRQGSATRYTYDALGRKISAADALHGTTTYGYDGLGNLTSITDALGNTTSYTYDANNKLITETYADGTTRRLAYDAVGNLITRTDQKSQVTAYVYDALNRRVKVDYPGTNDGLYTYDGVGNLATANNSDATISLTYDNIYRLTQAVQNGQTVAYSHDTAAGIRSVTYPGGRLVREIRNTRGLLTRVEDVSGHAIVEYAYDIASRVRTRTSSNGVIAHYEYNPNWQTAQLTFEKDGSQILGFQYGFDREDGVLYAKNLDDTTRSEQYVYDAKHRLVQFKRGSLDASGTITTPMTQTVYGLDALGNWTSKTTDGVTENRAHNNMNELVNIGGVALTYDNNGNLIDDGTNTYEYDCENHLVQVTQKSDGTVLAKYKYDALGRRIGKELSATTIVYYYDLNRVVEEHTVGSADATYVYGAALDEVVSMERGGQAYHHHANFLGSIVALTDGEGHLAEQYAYDPYGQSTPMSSSLGNPYTFVGRRLDTETGLQYGRSRYLSPYQGRWTTRDPLYYQDTMNLYEYARSNPLFYVDADGQQAIEVSAVALTGPQGALVAAAIVAGLCAADQQCRSAVGNAVSAAVNGVTQAITNVCVLTSRIRCRFERHPPHHSFLMPRMGIPPWKWCYMNHTQVICWLQGVSGSQFVNVHFPYGPCYKYFMARPPVIH